MNPLHFRQWHRWAIRLVALLPALPTLAQPTITALNPIRNARTAARPTNVAVSFSQAITVGSSGNLKVFSAQAGGKKAGAYSGGGTGTITFNPTTDFKPGEVVSVSIPNSMQNGSGQGAAKQVYQFTTAAAVGPMNFVAGTSVGTGGGPVSVALADVDGDGDLDILTANSTADNVSVRLNNGSGSFSGSQEVAVGAAPYDVKTGDLDSDGDLDFVTANRTDNTLSVRINNGAGSFTNGATISVGANPQSVQAGDLDGDGDLDLSAVNRSSNTTSIRLNTGNATFTSAADVATGLNSAAGALADVDNDGDLDLVVTISDNTNTFQTCLNNGNGTFGAPISTSTAGGAVTPPTSADVDGDGDLDVLLPSTSSTVVSVRLSNGAGSFSGTQNVAVDSTAYAVTTGDLDGDGDLDLLATSQHGKTVSIRLNNGSGIFSGGSDVAVGASPRQTAVGDLNGDGDLDFVTVNAIDNNVSVVFNQVPPPTISSFNPTSGPPGTQVVVTGTGFTNVGGAGLVGSLGSFSVQSATQLTFTVPAGAITAPVTVQTTHDNVTSTTSFTVCAAPTIAGFTWAGAYGTKSYYLSASAGTWAQAKAAAQAAGGHMLTVDDASEQAYLTSITGGNITWTGLTDEATENTFAWESGSAASYRNWNAGEPNNASNEDYAAMLANGLWNDENASSTHRYWLEIENCTSPPKIGGFTPASAPVGHQVVLTGANFTGATAVTFNGASASFTVNSATELVATVPAGVTAGQIRVVKADGTAVSINSFAPCTAASIAGFGYAGGYGANSYYLSTASGTWTQARAAAQATGGHMLTVDDASEQAYLATITGGNITWTGLTDEATENTFAWESGSAASYRNWNAGEPNNASNEDYAAMLANGLWNDENASSTHRYWLEVPACAVPPSITSFSPTSAPPLHQIVITGANFTGATAVTFNGVNALSFTVNTATEIAATVPVAATAGRIRVVKADGTAVSTNSFSPCAGVPITGFGYAGGYGTKSYYLSTATGTWAQAKAAVQAAGGHLLTINSASEQAYIATITGGNVTWIGFTDEAVENTFAWESGEPVTYTNWNAGEPNNASNEDYAQMLANGIWNDAQGGFTLRYWLEIEACSAPPGITSFTPASAPTGHRVTITGANFTGATAVTFNGVNAAFTVNSATEIGATVPVGVTAGPIRVVKADGTAVSISSFTPCAAATIAGFVYAGGYGSNSYYLSTASGTWTQAKAAAQAVGGHMLTVNDVSEQAYLATITSGNTTWIGLTDEVTENTFAWESGAAVSYTNWNPGEPNNAGNEDYAEMAANGKWNDNAGTATYRYWLEIPLCTTPPSITAFSPTGPVGHRAVITGTNFTGATAVSFNGTAAPAFTVVSATQLLATVPAGATTGPIRVTTTSGTAVAATAFTVCTPATITGYTYRGGYDNRSFYSSTRDTTWVLANANAKAAGGHLLTIGSAAEQTYLNTIIGSVTGWIGFNDEATEGTFEWANGDPVTYTNWNSGEPSNTNNEDFAYMLAGGTWSDLPYGFERVSWLEIEVCTTPPRITSFTPNNGPAGTSVTITGANFTGATAVAFNGVNAPGFVVSSATQITVNAPAGATAGFVQVTTPQGTATSVGSYAPCTVAALPGFTYAGSFDRKSYYLSNAPTTWPIANATAQAAGGQLLTINSIAEQTYLTTITGGVTSWLGLNDEAVEGTFGWASGEPVTYTNWSGGAASPSTAQEDYAQLLVNGHWNDLGGYNLQRYLLEVGLCATPPAITSFTPTSGVTGTSVTITGANFTGATAVTFNGVVAPGFVVNSANQITVNAPAGATAGTIRVTTPGGTAISVTGFAPCVQPTLAGYTYAGSLNGKSYFLSGSAMTWAQAKAATQAIGGQLPTIHNSAESAHLGFNGGGQSAWIGFTDEAVEGTFVWVSGEPVTYIGWASGEPNNAGDEDYAILNPNATWSDRTAASTLRTWLELPACLPAPTVTSFLPGSAPVGHGVTVTGTSFIGVTAVTFGGIPASSFYVRNSTTVVATVPAGFTGGTISVTTVGGTGTSAGSLSACPVPTLAGYGYVGGYGTKSYYLSTASQSWPNANAAAQVAGGHLLTISDAQEQAHLTTLIGGLTTWIGLNDVATEGSFVWTSGEPLTYTNWANTEPNGGTSENGGMMNTSGQWGDQPINSSLRAWLEVDICLPAPTVTNAIPASAPMGHTVVLTGTGFVGVTAVEVGGVSATFTPVSGTALRVAVPAAATSGPISVTTASGTGSASFTVCRTPVVPGYTYKGGIGTKSYFLADATSSWTTANLAATAVGGQLLTINDASEQAYITAMQISPLYYWTGLNDVAVEGTYGWVSGEPVTYTNWGGGQPTGIAGRNYVAMGANGLWADYVDGLVARGWLEMDVCYARPYITSFTPNNGPAGTSVTITGTNFFGVTGVAFNGTAAPGLTVNAAGTELTVTVPAGATAGPISVTNADATATSVASYMPCTLPALAGFTFAGAFGSKTYFLSTASATWANANAAAQATGGQLLTINSAAEQAYLTSLAVGVEAWTGFNDAAVEGTYGWASGESVTYTNWSPGEPNGGTNENYASMNSSGRWIDRGASSQFRYWVEIDACPAAPAITSFTPGSAPAGHGVEVTGTNFIGVTGVTFGGIPASSFYVRNSSTLVATVPAGFTGGPIAVTAAGSTGTSAGSLTACAAPSIAGYSYVGGLGNRSYYQSVGTSNWTNANAAAQAVGGQLLAITSATEQAHLTSLTGGIDAWIGFTDAAAEGVFVWTSGEAVTYTNWNPVGSEPNGGTGENYTYMNAAGRWIDNSNALLRRSWLEMVVCAVPPAITGFTPTSGAVGQTITINGANFSSATSVRFNGTVAPGFVVGGGTTITVNVPLGATTGKLSVTNPDGTAISAASFTVTSNAAPVVANQLFLLPENSANATVVGTIAASDPNGHALSYAITAGNTGGAFGLNASTGLLTVANTAVLDVETTPSFALTVQVTDNGVPSESTSATVTVNLTNVNEGPTTPTDANPAANTVAENAANGTLVGLTVTAADVDGPTRTYSLTDDAGGRFAIQPTTGVVRVADGSLLDFEAATSHSITAQVSDGSFQASQSFTIQLTDVDEVAPTVVIGSPASNPTTTNPIAVTVTFSEPVTGLTLTDLTVGNGAASNLSGSGTTYTVDVAPLTSGLVTVDLATDAAQDATGNASVAASQFSITFAPVNTTWTGAVSTSWFTPGNWSNGEPSATTDALIPAGAPRYPIVVSGVAVAKNLVTAAAASIRLNAGTLQIHADFDHHGTFTQNGGVVELVGAGQQQVGGSSPLAFRDLTVGAGGATLTGPVSVLQLLTLAGNLASNGQLTLRSTSSSTVLVVNAGGVVSGASTVQRYLTPGTNPGAGYRHLSSPVTNSTVADLATTGFVPKVNIAYNAIPAPALPAVQFPNVFAFDETRGGASISEFELGYYSPTALTDALAAGRGYAVYMRPLTPDFVGTLGNGDVSVTNLTRTGTNLASTEKSGWHLLGNPYPSPIDWDLVTPGSGPGELPAGMSSSISVFKSTGANSGLYLTRANGLGTLPDGMLPMGQAFFARVTGAGPVDFTFTNALRVTSYENPAHYRPAQTPRPVLSLVLRTVGAPAAEQDETIVYGEMGATTDYDEWFDGARPGHNQGTVPTLVSLTRAGEELGVNGLPETALTQPTTVELLLDLPAMGTYTLSRGQWENLPATAVVKLIDRLTGVTYDLSQQPTVTISAQRVGEVRGRFALVFCSANVVTGSRSVSNQEELKVWPNPAARVAQVSGLRPRASVVLLDLTGRVVRTIAATVSGEAALEVAGLPAGLYTVQAEGLTQRLIVE